jgi:hypothetical protein
MMWNWLRIAGRNACVPVGVLLLALGASAQDVLTVTETGGQVVVVSYEWAADSSGNATGRTSVMVPGIVFSAVTTPGAGVDAPTDNYDVIVKQVFTAVGGGVNVIAADVAGGNLVNRDSATPEVVNFWPSTVVPFSGYVQIDISNAGNANTGRVEIAIARHLALQTSDLMLVGGSAGQVLQYEAPGLVKFVTISGDGTLADGGALTVSGGGGGGSGTVTSVAISGSDGLEIDSGSPITTTGTIAMGVNAASLWSHLLGASVVTAVGADKLLIGDASNSFGLRAVLVSDFALQTDLHAAVTLAGSYDYLTLSGQQITLGQIDLATDATGNLAVARLNSGTGASANTFWQGDGTWSAVNISTADVTGTLPAASVGAGLTVAQGGTGVATLGDAGVVIGNGTGAVNVTTAGTSLQALISNGAGVDPTFQSIVDSMVSNTLTSSLFVGSGSTTNAIDLATAEAAGTLTVAKGGTGVATLGDAGVLIGNATGVVQVTSAGTAGQVLTSNGAAVDPTFQAVSVTATTTNTFTNKRITKRDGNTPSSATPTINTDNVDMYRLTAQAVDITSFTTNLTGTPVVGDVLDIWVTGTAARAITWGASFTSGPATLPTTTVTTKTLFTRFQYDGSIWVCMATGSKS